MTRLVLVRHGETVWHAENRYAGSSDIELTDLGREQAERLGAWAATAGLAAVYCSDLTRAQVTAAPAAKAVGVPPVVDPRFRELDFGQAEGMTIAEMGEQFPDALAAFTDDPVAGHLPGGEDPVACAERYVDGLLDIAAAHPDGRVLVVAHSTATRLALCRLLGIQLREYRRIMPALRNGALNEIQLRPDENAPSAALITFNAPAVAST